MNKRECWEGVGSENMVERAIFRVSVLATRSKDGIIVLDHSEPHSTKVKRKYFEEIKIKIEWTTRAHSMNKKIYA